MTCCIGKARIYYEEPIGFKLIYSGSANGEVIAPEALEHTCLPEFPPDDDRGEEGQLYDYHFTATYWDEDLRVNIRNEGIYSGVVQNIPGIVGFRTVTNPYSTIYGNTTRTQIDILSNGEYFASIGLNYVTTVNAGYGVTAVGVLIPVLGEPIPFPKPVYRFKVFGIETGTIYREISGLDECPAVENLGCVMGEETHVDVSMHEFSLAFRHCIKSRNEWGVFGGDIVIERILETRILPGAYDEWTPAPWDIPMRIAKLKKLEGCLPTYRVVCCPDADCDPKERCPPDTDCSLDCGDFVCCYKNGKVIKTVRK
jgi:hypothetical protein